MKQWTKEIEINAPIEKVWNLLNGSLEQIQKIMPQVIGHSPVKLTEEVVGSIYRQQYKEGKRIEEYDVETLDYLNDHDQKKIKVGFTLANLFEITALYEMKKMNDQKTHFKYTTTNKPLKWFLIFFMLFATEKVVVEFVERVKIVAETER